MYPVSDLFKIDIRAYTRVFDWYGTIIDKNNRSYNFTANDIVQNSTSIIHQCSGNDNIEIGSVYAAELSTKIRLDVDRYTLYSGTISLVCKYLLSNGTWEDVPIGIFNINEATRSASDITIKAYDNMVKFDKAFVTSLVTGTGYQWVKDACDTCGVTFAMSMEEFNAINANADKIFTIHENNDINTYRDLLHYIGICTCSYAQINRSGQLIFKKYHTTSQYKIDPSQRYSSDIADYESYYTHISITYDDEIEGSNTDIALPTDDGLTFDIGNNPLMQLPAVASDRNTRLQNVFNDLMAFRYTPFEASIPFDPSLEPGDVITLTGNQADETKLCCITDISSKINGQMSIKGVGNNPRLISPDTDNERRLSKLEQKTDKDTLQFYTFNNSKSIDLAEEKETEVCMIRYITVKACTLIFDSEIIYEVETIADSNSYNDAIVQAFIYMNEEVIQKYVPTETVQDGKHILRVLLPFTAPANNIGTIKIKLLLSGATGFIDENNIRAYIMGTGIVGEGVWDGTITISDIVNAKTDIKIDHAISDNITAMVQVPVGAVITDTVITDVSNISVNTSVNDTVLTGTNIMVYRPGVNDALVSITNCKVSNNAWASTADGATIVIERLYGIKSIKGVCDADVTFAFSPDGQNWKGYNAIAGEIQDDYEMSWSIVQEMTAELWASFDQYWLRATIPNGKKLTQLSIEGGYVQYAVTYSDGVNGDAFEDVIYKVGYAVATPKFKNGGTPTRKDYTFDKWSPELQSVVTKDITYSATWILSLTVATLTFDESYKGLQYTVKSSSGEENYEGTVEDTLKAELRLQRLSTEYIISIGTYEQKFTTGTESGTMEVTVNAN